MSKKVKVTLWLLYTLCLVGAAYLVTEGFYIANFWKWVLS